MYGLQIVLMKCINLKIKHFFRNSAEEAEAEAIVDSLNGGLRGSPVEFFRMNVTGMMCLVILSWPQI